MGRHKSYLKYLRPCVLEDTYFADGDHGECQLNQSPSTPAVLFGVKKAGGNTPVLWSSEGQSHECISGAPVLDASDEKCAPSSYVKSTGFRWKKS